MRHALFLLPLLLAGCIPPSDDAPQYSAAPRINPDMTSVSQAQPVWEAHPAAGNVIDVPGGTYTVLAGESLHAIGIKTGVGWETLARVNGLTPPFIMTAGTQLTVPAGRYHVVQAGESGIAIARAHGVHWAQIIALNGLADPFIIHTDQRLLLPAGNAVAVAKTPATPTKLDADMAARAAAFNLDDVVSGGGEPAQDLNTKPSHEKVTAAHPLAPTTPVAEPHGFTNGGFSWPLNGAVTGKFGVNGNRGIDIAAPSGSLVSAAANGVVAFVGPVAGYGGTIILRHGDGWLTIYSHVGRVSVVRGAQVRRGQTIAITEGGESSKLHFEIRQRRTPVDPMKKLG